MGSFVFHPLPQPGKVIMLSEEETHHLSVQRILQGTSVLVSDGKGRLYRGTFLEKQRSRAFVLVEEEIRCESPGFSLSIWQGFLKSPSRMDWLVEKLAEIGVTEIGFFPAERSVKEEVSQERVKRWEKVVLSACKQSGRIWFPLLRVFTSWKEFLSVLPGRRVFLADPLEKQRLSRALKEGGMLNSVGLVVGPEGDFTEKERRELLELGVQPVSLHQKVLRSETAALLGAFLLVTFLEDHHAGEH